MDWPSLGWAMSGAKLLKTLVSATGLPKAGVEKELDRLLVSAGKSPENLTIDELRELLAEYLQEVLLSAKQEFSAES